MISQSSSKSVYVYSHAPGKETPDFMGTMHVSEVRGREVVSFEYDLEYLESGEATEFDPNLKLYSGFQYTPTDRENFGIFLDSAPDRWGRVLMDRKEGQLANKEDRKPKKLKESDYLLGVFDESRIGALRFKLEPAGNFVDDDHRHTTPPFTSLRELEYASRVFEDDSLFDSEEYREKLDLLLAPGSSLGGARPKASVRDEHGGLWIAKFPSLKDDINQGAWEFLVYKLAVASGIKMSTSMAEKYYSDYHTFLTKRFDRENSGLRVHFFSAMTLLGHKDGTDAHSGASYLELAEFILRRGSHVDEDLQQLWTRIAFNVAVSNTDDHLRNHGFLYVKDGFRLSPAYDINPNPKGYGLTLNIDEHSNHLDIDLVMSVTPYFRLKNDKAKDIVKTIRGSVSQWELVADSLSISRREKADMSTSFKLTN
jgi:serine/threonine-protein kinase HipA